MRLATVCLLCLTPAAAGAADPQDAEALINQCWAAAQGDLNSGDTMQAGRGFSAVIGCLEREIVLTVEDNQECAPMCGSAYNNVGGFELAKRLEGVLRDVVAEGRHPR
jgi:hypothetical protein